MRDEERIFLDGIVEMKEQANSVGLCSLPFLAIYDFVMELIAERDKLLEAVEHQNRNTE